MSTDLKTVETPSGKGAADENFPVGSFLLPKRLRPHVMTYYAFARAIDDIADDPDTLPQDKIAGLNAMDDALLGRNRQPDETLLKATALRASMLETNVDLAHASDLVSAFRQDAVQNRYNTWDDLIDYCMRSASPVGRYLLSCMGRTRRISNTPTPCAMHFRSSTTCRTVQMIFETWTGAICRWIGARRQEQMSRCCAKRHRHQHCGRFR